MKLKIWLASGWLTSFILSFHAFAALGGDVSSIDAEKTQMKAALQTASGNSQYTIYEMRTPSGTAIREYATLTGKIFAVAWQGPTVPDLQKLLGTYFSEYSEAAKGKHEGHSRLAIQRSGLVAYSTGHMRSFSGKAYVPQTLPPGMTANEIK